jgi:hypothetical protein
LKVGETLPPRPGTIWIFDRIPLTLNKLLRTHWAGKKRDLESWKTWVLGVAGNKTGVEGKVRVGIVVYRVRLQDPDNATGSVKPLVDALNRLGWMVDDSVKWLELGVVEVVARDTRTEVCWEPLDT